MRKRSTTSPPSDSDDTSQLAAESEENVGQIVKKRKVTSKVTASSEVRITSEEETFQTNHSEALPNLSGEIASQSSSSQNHPNSKHTAADPHFRSLSQVPDRKMGPVKAPTNVRTTITTDYQPDVCKDYKQTGFCGFGDGCKFLHAREDYKQGWALDRDWEIQTLGKKPGGTIISSAGGTARAHEEAGGDESQLEKIPFKCIICKGDYKNPVVTQCGHYFCGQCALQRYKKHPSCKACGQSTLGVFNVARNLQKMLDRKQTREERLNG